ncbi:MAG TPA: SET domain-containing protein [Vicinamibacterales bacterium]|nr:SET domain-containing protein [Vicinamibacterales bacterium]
MDTTVRLAATKAGVGVRAVRRIRKGDRIDAWEPGDMIYVPLESVRDIEYLKWLNVFGIIAWKGFYAPRNPMRMSVAWYINHSTRPNVTIAVTPSKWIIRARREIRPGEELTVDYGTLDFNPALKMRKQV